MSGHKRNIFCSSKLSINLQRYFLVYFLFKWNLNRVIRVRLFYRLRLNGFANLQEVENNSL